jgi:hypothetical protein
MKIFLKSLLFLLFIAMSVPDAGAEGNGIMAHDVTNRCSMVNAVTLAGFNADVQGWKGLQNCAVTLSDCSGFEVKPQEGVKSLLVTALAQPANTWKGIAKDYAKPLNLSKMTLIEFSIFATSVRPGREDYVRLVLSDGKQNFECRSEIIPSMWRTVTFDITSCPFLKNIRHIEISAMNNTAAVWDKCNFLFDNVRAGLPLDLMFSLKGSSRCFTAVNGKLGEGSDAMSFNFKKNASVGTTALKGSRNSIYNPPVDTFNTFFIVLANKSAVSKVRLYYATTEHDTFDADASKVFNVIPNSGPTAYYVNISDTKYCRGHLTGFRLQPVDGNGGEWLIDRVSLLQENPIEKLAGRITSCTADKKFIDIKGTVTSDYVSAYPVFEVYEAPMFDVDGVISAAKLKDLTRIYQGTTTASFDINSIANSRLGGKMSRLCCRLLAVVRNAAGDAVKVAPYFYIDNWRDFEDNPYAFKLPERTFSVLDYGAKGDGFTDDTEAINKAIDACNEAGGGQVILPDNLLPGVDSVYGRRYVATNIRLKSNVDLHIAKNAVIWQSADRRDYRYNVYYGHNTDIPDIPWTHCLFVNLPLIEALDATNVKVTGEGKILMYSRYTVNPDIFWLHAHCSDQIHVCPLGVSYCKNVEISDINILLSPNYFTQFTFTTNLFIGNVRMAYPTCTSGDGLGFSCGMKNVKVVRAIYNSNDDGVTITSSYGDPRNTISPWRPARVGTDNSVKNVVVSHSCINSDVGGNLGNGGAHAIAFLPWGACNPDPEKAEIDSISVYDCILRGPYAVGIWPDTPFDGKPFTNEERDDYSAIKNVDIRNNDYVNNNCDFLWVTPTNMTGDTGIHSAGKFMNGDFKQGHCYWTTIGDASVKDGCGYASNGGSLCEGLYLNNGDYIYVAEVKGSGELQVIGTADSRVVATLKFNAADWQKRTLNFTIPATGDYFLGVKGNDAAVRSCAVDAVKK